jgi:hypothetical protein
MLLLVLVDGVEIPLQFPPYKTIPDFPLLVWIALIFTTLGLLSHFLIDGHTGGFYTWFIIVLLVVLFYGLIPASENVLRWHDSWLHAGITSAIIETGHTDPTTLGYHSWPGFFFCLASVSLVSGIDVITLSKFFQVIPNVLAILIVFAFYKRLSLHRGKEALLGVIVFILANDRMYYHVCPMNFSFALFLVFFYFNVFRFSQRSFWGLSFILLFANVISHFFTPLYLFSFFFFLWLAEHIFSLPTEQIPRYFNIFIIGLSMWIGWSFYVVDYMWWSYGVRVLPSIEARMTGYAPMLRYTPTYWRWAGSTLYVESFRIVILAIVLALALLSVLVTIRRLGLISFHERNKLRLKLRRTLDKTGWVFIVLTCLILAVIVSGILPFVALREIMGFADRFLLFVWLPLAIFAVMFISTSSHRKIKKCLTVILIVLLIPAFVDVHWHEFWLSTHRWEVDGMNFVKVYCNSSSTFLTDSGTIWLARAMVSFDIEYLIEEMGMRGMLAREGDALSVFNGTLSPLNLTWGYLIRSKKGEVRLNLYYGIPLSTSNDFDLSVSNIPLLNRVYDNNHLQIYQREIQNASKSD